MKIDISVFGILTLHGVLSFTLYSWFDRIVWSIFLFLCNRANIWCNYGTHHIFPCYIQLSCYVLDEQGQHGQHHGDIELVSRVFLMLTWKIYFCILDILEQ